MCLLTRFRECLTAGTGEVLGDSLQQDGVGEGGDDIGSLSPEILHGIKLNTYTSIESSV